MIIFVPLYILGALLTGVLVARGSPELRTADTALIGFLAVLWPAVWVLILLRSIGFVVIYTARRLP